MSQRPGPEERDRLVLEYQQLARVAAEYQRRIDLLNAALDDVLQAKAAVDELKLLEDGEEILVPLGANVMVRASYRKTGKLLVSVGGGVMLERDFEGVREYLERREKTLRELVQRLSNEYQRVISRMSEIERRLGAT